MTLWCLLPLECWTHYLTRQQGHSGGILCVSVCVWVWVWVWEWVCVWV